MMAPTLLRLATTGLLVATPWRGAESLVYDEGRFALHGLGAWEMQFLRECPCASRELCLPVDDDKQQPARKEVFAFSVATDDRWKQYDWEKVTTIAWNVDKELLCHAHSKGVKVVVKHNFDEPEKLCDPVARRQWIRATYEVIVRNYADGVNIDTEKPMHGEQAACQTLLVRELREELQRHPFTAKAQITFDVPWAPRGIDGRFYQWKQLADAVDFLFVMSYDMRSQIYYQCIASANSPLALVKQGLEEFIHAYGIEPKKLVLGVPWYGYKYSCESFSADNAICAIKPEPFFGAPCSDAAGSQIDYGDVRKLLNGRTRHWDAMTQSPFLTYRDGAAWTQLWYDDEQSLALKYALVKQLGLRGVGMWNADTAGYAQDAAGARHMWQALEAIY